MTLDQIRARINELREAENGAIEREWRKHGRPSLLAMVGKTFVYRNNSYGTNAPKWDVFKRILSVVTDKSGTDHLIVEIIEIDGCGHPSMKVGAEIIGPSFSFPRSGWSRCPLPEYQQKLNDVTAELADPIRLRNRIEASE